MLDHSTLPSIANARLPQTYEAAKTALAECSSIDECKDWADKAAALASYAKMSDDDSLRKMAERIQARAIRRCGELLRQIDPSKGGDPSLFNAREGGHPSVTRASMAQSAGLSAHQQKQAIRVAGVPEEQFSEMIDSEEPPTVTKLAQMGTKRQVIDLKGRDPKHFNKAMHFIGNFEHYLKECKQYDVEATVKILTDKERDRLRSAINGIDAIHDAIMTRI